MGVDATSDCCGTCVMSASCTANSAGILPVLAFESVFHILEVIFIVLCHDFQMQVMNVVGLESFALLSFLS